MRHLLFVGGLAVVFVVCAVAVHAEPDIHYGKWEFETTIHSPMMPQPMTQTSTQCITKETFYPKPSKDDPCPVQNVEVNGNVVTWEADCKTEGGRARGSGRVVYDGDTSQGKIDMTMEAGGREMKMDYEMKGRRIGDCD